MNPVIELFEPLIVALLELVAHVGAEMMPEVKVDAKDVIVIASRIIFAYATFNMSSVEAKDSFAILIDQLEAKGATLLGKLEIHAEELPATIMLGLTASLGSVPGALMKLV